MWSSEHRWSIFPTGTRSGHRMVLIFLFLLSCSEKSLAQTVEIGDICNNSLKTLSSHTIDGAVVTSRNNNNIDCAITFQTTSILQRFMLRFDHIQLDCNDHLLIYDGFYSVKADLSCGDSVDTIGRIETENNFLTLKFVPSQTSQVKSSNGFRLILTAFKHKHRGCHQFLCKGSKLCIDRKLTCDGVKNCEDGSDESSSLALCPESHIQQDEPVIFYPNRGIGLQRRGEVSSTFSVKKNEIIKEEDNTGAVVEEESVAFRALKSAINWTRGQMGSNWGWGSDTPNTVLALALANSSFFPSKSLEAQLMTKEYELHLVLQLWKHKEAYMTAGHLALNVMVLMALCQDPRNFYSKDLIATLEHKENNVDFEVAFGALASCSAGRHIRKSKIRKLLDIILDQSKIHSVDTLSVVILALHCSQGQRKQDLSDYITESTTNLLLQQMDDGSFSSNLHSTAIALQAMSASGFSSSWNATRALQYVMSHQQSDGSFGNLFDTNAVLPILGGNTFLNITNVQCTNKLLVESPSLEEEEKDFVSLKEPSNFIPESVVQEQAKTKAMINMTYIIWAGNNSTKRFNMTFSVPPKTTFLEIMKMAAEENEKFQFSASKWANGYYIHTLAGEKEKQVGYWFWLLYRLREPPIPGIKVDNKYVVAQGVQELIPEDGDYILFWYHKI